MPTWSAVLGLLALLVFTDPALAQKRYNIGGDVCWICQEPIRWTVYMWLDEVAGIKREICSDCAELPHTCYLCSLPVRSKQTDLKDGRFLCERDAKSVLIDTPGILTVCGEVSGHLNRQLSRFVTFPGNVSLHVADRLTLVDLFKVPGKDYTCPNVLGFTCPETNQQGAVEYSISILSGQTRAATEATCAHELSHAWIMANVSEPRRKSLHRDAVEGFCELVAFVMMRDKSETVQMAQLRTNLYTRGQLDLFIDAEQRFGFGQVVDWVKYGETTKLVADEPWRVQEAVAPRATNVAAVVFQPHPASPEAVLPERLELKSISMGRTPFALINQCTLGVGETGKVRLATTNLTIRCQAIRPDSVLIEIVGTGETRELRFENKSVKAAK